MSFTNGAYYVFLIAVFFGFWSAAVRWRVVFLVAASCFFYWQAGAGGLLLLALISAVNFTAARLICASEMRGRRRLLLSVSLLVDVGALCVFKYADFFTGRAMGIVAPLGMSFYIFQSLAYVIDVYRKDAEPAASFIDYFAFASFFPTIVAGPILRVRQLLPELRKPLALDSTVGGQALFLIAVGLIKKIAIADYLSANLVARVFDFPERFSSLEVLAAVYAYALEIYADFSGYSDIAIGSALLLGLRLPANFNAPYRAADLPEFWRRWHISLSNWLRDYVFFTVTGRRPRSSAVLYCGLVVTMLVGGLWHGPAWTFVLWGALHGAGLVAFRAWSALRKRLSLGKRDGRWPRACGVLITFHFVCLTWVFFRAETPAGAWAMLGRLSALSFDATNLSVAALLIIAFGFMAHAISDRAWQAACDGFVRLPALAQASLLSALAAGLYFVASTDVVPFIYSRF